MHLPPTPIDDILPPHKIARYTPCMIPASISVASENSISILINPSDSIYILRTDGTNTLHLMNKYIPLEGRVHRGYHCKKHGRKRIYKKTSLY